MSCFLDTVSPPIMKFLIRNFKQNETIFTRNYGFHFLLRNETTLCICLIAVKTNEKVYYMHAVQEQFS